MIQSWTNQLGYKHSHYLKSPSNKEFTQHTQQIVGSIKQVGVPRQFVVRLPIKK